ncbi:hypothetical protein HUT06_09210 [Actinomadura sp. NAK00032]|uniref:hypothetical protein n=1 Tax=Actinomadura sp. NAK00032 TaxID=2742128 RepID=UPI00159165CE|nr:hypothetical protein [Actinomadura sp. NAK00032]QKW34180.1 hypothetical protein HUT06_09210 [Actinomadura sp. NAK00032]
MRLTHRLVVATAAVLLLAGCSGSGDDEASSSGAVSTTAAGAAVPASEAGYDNAAKPVVQGTFDSPAAVGAKVDIAIMGLKAKGKLATLTVRFTPHVPGARPGRINGYGLNGNHRLGTSLIDPVNLKRYIVVKDSDGKSLESDDIFTHMTNDQPTPYYFTFAAPPENVKSIDVQIGTWPTFRNIPVER